MRWEKETLGHYANIYTMERFPKNPHTVSFFWALFPFSCRKNYIDAFKPTYHHSNVFPVLPRVFKVRCLTKINLTFKDGGFWTASTSAKGIWELKFGNSSPPTGLYLRIVYLHKDNTLSTDAQRGKAFPPWLVYFYSFIQTTSIYRALPLHWALHQALEILRWTRSS